MKFDHELDIGMKSLGLILRLIPLVLVLLYVTQHSRSMAKVSLRPDTPSHKAPESAGLFSTNNLLSCGIFFVAGAVSTSNLIKIGVL